jgi:hypothetical protein
MSEKWRMAVSNVPKAQFYGLIAQIGSLDGVSDGDPISFENVRSRYVAKLRGMTLYRKLVSEGHKQIDTDASVIELREGFEIFIKEAFAEEEQNKEVRDESEVTEAIIEKKKRSADFHEMNIRRFIGDLGGGESRDANGCDSHGGASHLGSARLYPDSSNRRASYQPTIVMTGRMAKSMMLTVPRINNDAIFVSMLQKAKNLGDSW